MTLYRRVVTGVSTLIATVKLLCRLETRYGAKLDEWIGANLSTANAATVRSWIAMFQEVCIILEAAPDD